jgi:hypothetical protein
MDYTFGNFNKDKRFWDCVIVEGRIVEYKTKNVEGPLVKGARPQHVTVKGNIPEHIRENVKKELSRLFPVKEIEYESK